MLVADPIKSGLCSKRNFVPTSRTAKQLRFLQRMNEIKIDFKLNFGTDVFVVHEEWKLFSEWTHCLLWKSLYLCASTSLWKRLAVKLRLPLPTNSKRVSRKACNTGRWKSIWFDLVAAFLEKVCGPSQRIADNVSAIVEQIGVLDAIRN